MIPFDEYYDRAAVERALLKLGIRLASREEEERILASQVSADPADHSFSRTCPPIINVLLQPLEGGRAS